MIKRIVLISAYILFLFGTAAGQTFTFECKCEHVTGSNCDVCNATILGRSFHGLLIKRNGTPYRWIDEPYTVRQLNGEVLQFIEQIPNPDQINIARFQTIYSTMAGFRDSTNCFCNLGGGMAEVTVDTPMVGDGTPGNPITIGQFGADTTKFLNWNGHHWYPGSVDFTDINLNLPYYTGDAAALADGLSVGDPYLLECNNDYALPAGMFKVVKICGFDCAFNLLYFQNDAFALGGGIPYGREYVLNEDNAYGILYGFIKVVTTDTITDGTLECNTSLPAYPNDIAAIIGGLAFGDQYTMTAANTYGAPTGMVRVVSSTSSTNADAPICCAVSDRLPFFSNDTAAISGGLSSGYYYYLTASNTYAYPYGSKKRIP